MTADQAKELKQGDNVIFCFRDGREIRGKVTRTHKEYINIEWADGYPSSFELHDMQQVELVEE